MKNKHNTYILLILVLAVWGMIGYRIFSSLNNGDDIQKPKNIAVSFHPKSIKEQDTFAIHSFPRDPFLGTFKTKAKKENKNKAHIVKEEVIWPKVSFSGMMSDTGSNQKIFFIYINNVQYLMKLHDKMMDITLVKATKKDITLRFKGEQKKITVSE